MKKSYLKLILTVGLISTSFFAFSQTKVEIEKIKKKSNVTKLLSLSKTFKANSLKDKERALRIAKQKGWKITYKDDKGSFYQLAKVTEDGIPMYFKTYNSDAALSTRTNNVLSF